MFDREVANTFLQYVPVYPKGMQVILSDGRAAIVVENNKSFNLRPILRLMDGTTINLMDMMHYSTLTIVKQADEDTATPAEIEAYENNRLKAAGA